MLLWIFLARQWSVDEFGRFSVIFAWTAIYGLVIDLGLDFWVTRQASLNNGNAFSTNLIKFRVLSSVLIGIIFYLIGVSLGYAKIPLLLLLCGAFILNICHFFSCYLRATERLSVEAAISVVKNISYVVLAGVGVYFGLNLVWVGFSYLFCNVLFALLMWQALVKNGFLFSEETISLRGILKVSMPVWICGLLFGLSIKVDFLLLEELINEAAVARFSAAARIFEGFLLLATAFVLTLFPLLSRQFNNNVGDYPLVMYKYAKLLLALSLMAGLIGAVVGGQVFTLLYGVDYQSSARTFVILMAILPISALVFFLYNGLIIAHQFGRVMIILLVGAVINVVLDLWLIPILHIDGILLTIVSKELFLLCCFSVVLYRLSNQNGNSV